VFLIRHAITIPSGFLFGRKDANVDELNDREKKWLKEQVSHCEVFYSSPARRCVETLKSVFPDKRAFKTIDAFWEQDFGDWEGLLYSDLPDIGTLSGDDLACFRPPNGESFMDLCERANPAFLNLLVEEKARNIVIFAHAGVIRAFLALAFSSTEAALKCEIDVLSLTRLKVFSKLKFSVVCVNASN